ncbi:MAG: hypothetical protein A4E28_02723 [Methanocella sp. PtaU1.Bin125]|nr:MAG: hypothetical protein A4E28_02723 [Methanocella sp. PtaU1.Bin125]
MSRKILRIFLIIFTLFACAVAPLQAQTPTPLPGEVDLGNAKGTIMTLYYYDFATGGKGDIVPLPDNQNPQEVQWDYNKAAPGTYTFYKVPFGIYYLEAVHGNNSFFAIVNVTEGTATANVAIPPNATDWKPVATPTPQPTPAPTAWTSPTPLPTSLPTPSPGMTSLCALAGLTIVAVYVVTKKK